MSAELVGDGTHRVQVSDHNGLVVLHFDKPVPWVALDPETASRVGEVMAKAAYKVRFGDTPTPVTGAQLTDVKRVRAIREAEIMLGSFEREAPRPDPKVAATRLVDAFLRQFS